MVDGMSMEGSSDGSPFPLVLVSITYFILTNIHSLWLMGNSEYLPVIDILSSFEQQTYFVSEATISSDSL